MPKVLALVLLDFDPQLLTSPIVTRPAYCLLFAVSALYHPDRRNKLTTY
jgi:hypothetical protein